MSAMARDLGISRQAVHDSVKRLVELDVVELIPQPGNSRDKLVAVTDRGLHARQAALDFIESIEQECVAIVGKRKLENFRSTLVELLEGLKENVPTKTQATGVKSSSSRSRIKSARV